MDTTTTITTTRHERTDYSLGRAFGISAACLFVVYFPFLSATFGIHNDYFRWYYDVDERFPEFYHLIAVGRFIGATLLEFQFRVVDDIDHLRWWRTCGFVLTLLNSYMLALYLIRRLQMRPAAASAVSVGIALLPSSLLYGCWVTNIVPGTFNTSLALIAAWIMPTPWQRPSRNDIVRYSGAAVVLLIALFIYPPTTYFVLVPLFAAIVSVPPNHRHALRRSTIVQMGILGTMSVLYYGLQKYGVMRLATSLWGRDPATFDSYRFAFSTTIDESLALLGKLVALSYQLWFANTSEYAHVGVIGALVSAQVVWYCRRRHDVDSHLAIEKITWGTIVFVSAMLPLLLSQGGSAEYRVIFPTAAMVVLLVEQGCRQLSSAIQKMGYSRCILVWGVAAMISATFDSYAIADGAKRELEFVRNRVAHIPLDTPQTIAVIAPAHGSQITTRRLRHEMGFFGSNQGINPGLLMVALHERGVPLSEMKHRDSRITIVLAGRQHALFAQHESATKPNFTVIDMNDAGFRVEGSP